MNFVGKTIDTEKPEGEKVWLCKIQGKGEGSESSLLFSYRTLQLTVPEDLHVVEKLTDLLNKVTAIEDGASIQGLDRTQYLIALFNGDKNHEELRVEISPPVIWLPDDKVGIVPEELPILLDEVITEEGEQTSFELDDFIENYVALDPATIAPES